MPEDDEYPNILTPEQVRFEISFGLHNVSRGLLREYLGKDGLKASQAGDAIVDTIAVRFEPLQVRQREAEPYPLGHIGNRSKP